MQSAKRLFQKEPVLTVAAVLAVVSMFFVPPSARYLSYIDFKTLACLFCLMTAVKGLEREGVLARMSLVLSARLKSGRSLALFLVFLCFFSAMFVTNDVALIALVPITLALLAVCPLGAWSAFIVILQTIAANIGSSLTPIGNPQNLFLFSQYAMSLSGFCLTMLPIVAAGGLMLAACCLLIPNTPLGRVPEQTVLPLRARPVAAYGALFLLSVSAVFDLLPVWAVTAAVLLGALCLDRRTLAQVDYSLLFTFVAIFVFVGNLGHIGSVHAFLASVAQKNTFLTAVVASQATSNVPAAILLSGFTNQGRALLLGVNVGGLGTLIASMASVISYKLFVGAHGGQAARYLRLFTLVNAAFLLALGLLGGWLA